jgi:hypothetical protein
MPASSTTAAATAASKRRPIVEDLVIPPYKRSSDSLLYRVRTKIFAETALGTLEPWERNVTYFVLLLIVFFSLYHAYTTLLDIYSWLGLGGASI